MELGKIFKCKDVWLLSKIKMIFTTVFPVSMLGCESWIDEQSRQRGDLFYGSYGPTKRQSGLTRLLTIGGYEFIGSPEVRSDLKTQRTCKKC